MSEQNKALIRRFLEEEDRRHTIPDELCAPGYTLYFNGEPPMDVAGHKQLLAMLWGAFPDFKHRVHEVLAEGDKVVVRGAVGGTHKGDLMRIAPTGKQVDIPFIAIVPISGGKIAEMRVVVDQMGMMQQLGVAPTPPGQAEG